MREIVDCDFGRLREDHFIENPEKLSVQPDREYSLSLEDKMKIIALFPLEEKEQRCNLVEYRLDGKYYGYFVLPGCLFIMNDSGKTIDKY